MRRSAETSSKETEAEGKQEEYTGKKDVETFQEEAGVRRGVADPRYIGWLSKWQRQARRGCDSEVFTFKSLIERHPYDLYNFLQSIPKN
jgi:hypothetical protein